jgi:hypothetical protein
MFESHMAAREEVLVAISKIQENSGHSLHKGTPREILIREFLETHLPESVAIGTGEIIDANSKPGSQRNQFDIVIYKRNYPKLDFGGGISGFLVESVIATVEVKSTLRKADVRQAVKAARSAKTLLPSVTSSIQAGYIPPHVLNYVVAYDGPAQIRTIYNWITQGHKTLGITTERLPQVKQQRLMTASPSIDAIFVLKKGFVYFDNVAVGLATSEDRTTNPDLKWVFSAAASGSLLLFFLMLQSATANIDGRWLNPSPYLVSFSLPDIQHGID